MSDPITEVATEKSELEIVGQALAESLNTAANPLEAKTNEMFIAEPFFKEEEVEAENKGGEEVKGDVAQEVPVVTDPIEPTDPVVPNTITEQDFLDILNESVGVEFSSVDEIKAIIEENNNYKANASALSGLTQEERARIELGREYKDFGLYDRLKSIDTTNIADKEALRQVYFLDNLGRNQQFLEKAFEKEFAKTYEEDPDEEFSKLFLQQNGLDAKNRLVEIQEGLKELGKVSGSADPEEAKKAKIEEDNKWFADVDSVIEKNDRVTYSLEDGLDINIVMDVKDKQTIQESMDRPIDYLKSRITDEKGNYDHAALYEFIMRDMYFEQIIEEARKSGAAHREEKILKEKKNIIVDTTSKAGDAGTQTPIREQIASNISRLINH